MIKKNKKIIISLISLILLLILAVISFYNTRKPIYIISDSIYYDTTISYQKNKLRYEALLNNKKIIFIVDREANGEWRNIDYEKDSTIIISPFISMLMDYDKDINFDNNLISIDYELERADLNVAVDLLSGYEDLANILKDEKRNVYLISSKDWPNSVTKALIFEDVFSNEGLTKIELTGNELEQKANDIVEKINLEKNVEVVSTGNSLISSFSNVENNILYNLEAYQSKIVDINSLHYVIYEDLTKLMSIKDVDKKIVLSTKLKDHQAGIVNFFLHLLRDFQQILF